MMCLPFLFNFECMLPQTPLCPNRQFAGQKEALLSAYASQFVYLLERCVTEPGGRKVQCWLSKNLGSSGGLVGSHR